MKRLALFLILLGAALGLHARWFDPTDGSYHAIGEIAWKGRQTFKPPAKNSAGEGDFVLFFE